MVSGTESLLVAMGAAYAALTTTSTSVADMVGAMVGKINFDLNNGHVRGVNLTAITNLLDGEPRSDARTDFFAATDAFSVSDGVMVTEDMRVAAPFFRLEGQDDVDLPAQSLDLLRGRAGALEALGWACWCAFRAPWTSLSFVPAPDAVDALRDASEEATAAATAEQETRDAVEGAAEEVRDVLLDRLFNR